MVMYLTAGLWWIIFYKQGDRMSKIKWMVMCVFIGVVLLFLAGALLQKGRGCPLMKPLAHKEWKHDEAALGLSPEQRAQMKALRDEFKVKRDALQAKIQIQREALRQELDGANPDRAKAEAIIQATTLLEQQRSMDHVDHVFKIRTILKPEQFQQLRQFHDQRIGQRGEHPRRHGFGPDNDQDAPQEK